MTEPGPPEPTEERDGWRDLAIEAVDLLDDWPELAERRDALLAAEDDQPTTSVP